MSLQVHDESTFRSGEVSPKRWFFKENVPFFSKGRGRSHMVSDFLVEHPSGPFFELSEQEWKLATEKYKTLTENSGINYLNRTATASIDIGTDAYFDNDTILSQFERLFQMLEFKQEYKESYINIDNMFDSTQYHLKLLLYNTDFMNSDNNEVLSQAYYIYTRYKQYFDYVGLLTSSENLSIIEDLFNKIQTKYSLNTENRLNSVELYRLECQKRRDSEMQYKNEVINKDENKNENEANNK